MLFHYDSSTHSTASTETTMSTSILALPGRRSCIKGSSSNSSRSSHSRFADYLAKEQQQVLTEEIRRCKSHVRNLEHSYKIRSQFKQERCKNPHCLLAKKYAADLVEEIETCKYELCSHHHDVCVNASKKPFGSALASLFRANANTNSSSSRRSTSRRGSNSQCPGSAAASLPVRC